MVAATVCIGFISMSVWAHHMFTIGMSSYANSFFAITTMAVGVPTGIKIFNWLGTMWGGKIQFKTPMLFCIGVPLPVPDRRADGDHSGRGAVRLAAERLRTSWWRTSIT